MRSKKTCLILIVVFVFSMLIFSNNPSFAQGLTTPCNGGDPDVDCPIDDGILFLVCTSVVFAIIKIGLKPTSAKQIVEFKPD